MSAREKIVASILWLDKRHVLVKITSFLIVAPFILLIASVCKPFERFWNECVDEAVEAPRD